MYTIAETHSAAKELDKAPKEIQEKYEFWKNIAKTSGVDGLKQVSGFKDHPLKGEWEGARSSSLNVKWRVIYYVCNEEILITIVRITAHDYRRK